MDGVRGLAAACIVVYHVWFFGPDGGQAELGAVSDVVIPHLPVSLTMFFTLSGFLLYRPFAAAVLRARPLPDLQRYLRNRALRILPAYWVILVVSALVLQTTVVRSSPTALQAGAIDDPAHLFLTAILAQNYRPSTLGTGITATWSLNVEVVFYLLLPLLAVTAFWLGRRAATRGGRRLAVLAAPALLLVIGFSGRVVAQWVVPGISDGVPSWNGDWHSVIERGFWFRADLLAFGMALGVLSVEVEDGAIRLPRHWRAYTLTAIVLMLPVVTVLSHGSYAYALMTEAICAGLLALVVLPPPTADRPRRCVGALESMPVLSAGLASYSVFLWNDPVIRWLGGNGLLLPGPAGFAANIVIAFVVVGLLSALTYRYVEVPALRRKVPRREPVVAQPAYQTQAAP